MACLQVPQQWQHTFPHHQYEQHRHLDLVDLVDVVVVEVVAGSPAPTSLPFLVVVLLLLVSRRGQFSLRRLHCLLDVGSAAWPGSVVDVLVKTRVLPDSA